MTLNEEQAAKLVCGAAGVTPAEVPPRPFGADWFREQPEWLAMSTAADRLVNTPSLDLAVPLSVAAALLEEEESDEIQHLVEVGFVEAMVCSASHEPTGKAEERILAACPLSVWRVWHRRRERLEALSDQPLAELTPPAALQDGDPNMSMMARCTTYRAESDRYVVLARVVSADRPSPWPWRHPILLGLIFLAILLFFFGLAWITG